MHTDAATYRGTLVPHWVSHLTVRLVRPDERERWRMLMARHHYLGFRGLVGESLYYVAELDQRWVALLGWAAAAWMCRAREQWIGWSRSQQWERLRFVANNARFLILPEVAIPNLASKVLALNSRRLADDWHAVYGHRIALAETFVDPARFAGTAYRAAGWHCLGFTRGFARHRHRYVQHGHPKMVWVRPLDSASPMSLAAAFVPAHLQGGTPQMLDFNTLNWTGPGGLQEQLAQVIDPRHRRGVRHRVDQVLTLALAAVLAGQRTFVGIGDWIQDLGPEQRAAFGCPRWGNTFKVPSEPTVRRVLQQLDADALDIVLTQWLTAESWGAGDAIAIDGKSVRGSRHGDRKRPVHLLSALVHRTGQVIGQLDVDIKTNEIPKLKDLLDPLDVTDSVITMDALHTQRETARYLVEEKHAHYVMEVKGNQPTLHAALEALSLEDFSPSRPHDRQGTRPN